jgi:hypothetical protein
MQNIQAETVFSITFSTLQCLTPGINTGVILKMLNIAYSDSYLMTSLCSPKLNSGLLHNTLGI